MYVLNQNGNNFNGWQKCKKKVYSVTAKRDRNIKEIYNILECSFEPVGANDVILKGTLGEEWPIGEKKFLSRYTDRDGNPLDNLVENGDFEETVVFTKAGDETYYACLVPKETECVLYGMSTDNETEIKYRDNFGKGYRTIFNVNSRSSVSDHGDGDYLMCCAGADGLPDTSDVWVVDGNIFRETYRLL